MHSRQFASPNWLCCLLEQADASQIDQFNYSIHTCTRHMLCIDSSREAFPPVGMILVEGGLPGADT